MSTVASAQKRTRIILAHTVELAPLEFQHSLWLTSFGERTWIKHDHNRTMLGLPRFEGRPRATSTLCGHASRFCKLFRDQIDRRWGFDPAAAGVGRRARRCNSPPGRGTGEPQRACGSGPGAPALGFRKQLRLSEAILSAVVELHE